MGKVRILDEATANRIAAGEVVERPASVVKELVENAIDAGGTRIAVNVEEGGLKSIRVQDDGSGMEADDCAAAFLRHATSKISRTRDLFRIATLGFRGEALPSIAAVAKVECVTCARADGLGRRIVIHGGKPVREEEVGAEQGTDIQVYDLFYNTPARLKYMKTIQTELGHITDFMYRLALARPDIAFTLRHNGKTLLSTPGNGDLRQVIASVYGTAAARNMLEVSGTSLDFTLEGWVSTPEWTRANRSAITTIINERYVRNYSLAKAVLEAYRTLLPIHRFPVAVLKIGMDPELVDVNVHPSKMEVKFSKEKQLYTFVHSQLHDALHKQSLIPDMPASRAAKPAAIQEQIEWDSSVSLPAPAPATEREAGANRSAVPGAVHGQKERAPMPRTSTRPHRSEPANMREAVRNYMAATRTEPMDVATRAVTETAATDAKQDRGPAATRFPKMYAIGQMRGTYIVAQNEEGLYLVDQHAAHERIHYEKFYRQFGDPAPVSQELLIPLTLELPPGEAEILRSRLALLEKSGVYLQPFGGNTFKVESYPHWLPAGAEREVIEEMVEWIVSEKQVDIARLREQYAITCSCRSSIKANESLSMHEIESLLEQLGRCDNPFTCPHGRPIVVSFSNYELEKMFKRVM